jgi:hypothetical protein
MFELRAWLGLFITAGEPKTRLFRSTFIKLTEYNLSRAHQIADEIRLADQAANWIVPGSSIS